MTSRAKRSNPGDRHKKREPRSGSVGKDRPVRRVPLAEVKDDLSRYVRLAVREEIVITRHGRPAALLIGFDSEDDWFEYQLENRPEFLRRAAEGRPACRAGRGVPLEDVEQ